MKLRVIRLATDGEIEEAKTTRPRTPFLAKYNEIIDISENAVNYTRRLFNEPVDPKNRLVIHWGYLCEVIEP